jgi:stalled ribosome rescue protein Dom34
MTKEELLDFLRFAKENYDAELMEEFGDEGSDGIMRTVCSRTDVDKVWTEYSNARLPK